MLNKAVGVSVEGRWITSEEWVRTLVKRYGLSARLPWWELFYASPFFFNGMFGHYFSGAEYFSDKGVYPPKRGWGEGVILETWWVVEPEFLRPELVFLREKFVFQGIPGVRASVEKKILELSEAYDSVREFCGWTLI